MTRRTGLSIVVFMMLILTGCSKQAVDTIMSSTDDPLNNVPDVNKQNRKISRGINLGNALEAPIEGEWGVMLKDDYFRVIKEKGFNSVRIPIKWSAHTTDKAPYVIDSLFFQRIDWAVNQALSKGLSVIINLQHYDELMQDPAKHKERFLAIWNLISEHYQSYSADLFFEVLNEPNNQLTSSLWNEYLDEAISLIRKKNPFRTIIAGPASWNSMDYLNSLYLPTKDKNIIVTYHYYNPMQFTHQGTAWVTGSEEWLGNTWLGTYEQMNSIIQDFDKTLLWSKLSGRPIYMGEFGTYYRADMGSRAKWTSFIARQAEQRGFSWAYWEFCAGFGVYDPVKNEWIEPLLNALIPPAS